MYYIRMFSATQTRESSDTDSNELDLTGFGREEFMPMPISSYEHLSGRLDTDDIGLGGAATYRTKRKSTPDPRVKARSNDEPTDDHERSSALKCSAGAGARTWTLRSLR